MPRRSVVYETGERLTAESVTSIPLLGRYVQQELGLDLPLGSGRRQAWYKFCRQEMEVQGWSLGDVALAVQFIKSRQKSCRTPYGIFWYVAEAKEWYTSRASVLEEESLQTKVAQALRSETDETWARKLSLAQGKALELVYENWVLEHAT